MVVVLLLLGGVILLSLGSTTFLSFGRLGLLAVPRVRSRLNGSRGRLSRSLLLSTRRTLLGLRSSSSGSSWLYRCLLLASALGLGWTLGLGLCVVVILVVRCAAVIWAFLYNINFVCLLGDLLATLGKCKSRLRLAAGLLNSVASLCGDLNVAVLNFIDGGFRISSTPWPGDYEGTR